MTTTIDIGAFSTDHAIDGAYFNSADNEWLAVAGVDTACTVAGSDPFEPGLCPDHSANYCSTNFDKHRGCRQPFKRGLVVPGKSWHELADAPFQIAGDTVATFVDNIKTYCGANGKTQEANYDTAAGKDDDACKGLRKEPVTTTEKTLAGLDPKATDLTCKADSSACLTATEHLHNTCWWARANNDGQFTLPHQTDEGGLEDHKCNSIYHCDMTVDDTVVVQPDALSEFNKCKNTDDKNALLKLYEKAVEFVEEQLEEHAPDLKPQAVPILITAIAIAALILLKLLSAIFGGGGRRYPYPMPPWPPYPQRR